VALIVGISLLALSAVLGNLAQIVERERADDREDAAIAREEAAVREVQDLRLELQCRERLLSNVAGANARTLVALSQVVVNLITDNDAAMDAASVEVQDATSALVAAQERRARAPEICSEEFNGVDEREE
jgi:hypothetical protein